MTTIIYWFRNDLRLADNPALIQACHSAKQLIPVYCHDSSQDILQPWAFKRVGVHRQHWLRVNLADLADQLKQHGSALIELSGNPPEMLATLARQVGASSIFCEEIAAPEEQAQVAALRGSGINVNTQWQSTMLHPDNLPFQARDLPDVFSVFRNRIERDLVRPELPLAAPRIFPSLPDGFDDAYSSPRTMVTATAEADARSSFPYHLPAFAGGETTARSHLERYLSRKLAHSYKATRNGLTGIDYSSKCSPWLAMGAISARTIDAEIKRFESEHGANDGTYWLWFELLWRDYFRLLHLKYGRRLYLAGGLTQQPDPAHDKAAFVQWCRGETGQPLVDAGMRELAATGYLSNRLRQIVASYLIYDLACDWRAGAAWFESQLIDYDVYSNQGNWLYIAGRGTDPRGGRRFNPEKQAHDYDPAGEYQALWRQPT